MSPRRQQESPRTRCICREANATAQQRPEKTDHTDGEGIWQIDELKMGENHLTKTGYRYCTIITIVKTRYVMIFLHKTRAEAPTIFLKAFAQEGKTPQILRADGEIQKWLNQEDRSGKTSQTAVLVCTITVSKCTSQNHGEATHQWNQSLPARRQTRPYLLELRSHQLY
jgi:hypothetical protein